MIKSPEEFDGALAQLEKSMLPQKDGKNPATELRKLMRELKSALSEQDQQDLAVLVKRGADVLMARGRQANVPNDLPEPGSFAHNGKERPR